MHVYQDLLRLVIEQGNLRLDRTGTGTYGLFGHQIKIDLTEGFPLLTTKRIHLKSIIHELLWFIKGDTNVAYLKEQGVSIWNEWADSEGNLGPVYGRQWRAWETTDGRYIDQLEAVIQGIKQDPFSRRHIVTAWNPGDIPKMALPPCHAWFQFYVGPNQELSCQLYQRSADVFLGVPFNIASYALLLMMVAQVCDLKPKMFVHTFGDLHLYQNHIDQAYIQLQRIPRTLPYMRLNPIIKNINDFTFDDFDLSGYNPYSKISAPIAV